MGSTFFGLTSVKKDQLFLEEIWMLMMAYPSMSYWDIYHLPVPFRKWFIRRYNKHIKDQEKQNSSSNEPLSKMERLKMIKDSQQNTNNSQQLAQRFLQPIHNK